MMAATVRTVVCLTLWISVCQVGGSYIPQEMNKTIQNLRQHYVSIDKISKNDLFDGKPIFSRDSLNGKIESKMIYLGGVLEAYEKLISHMLKQLPTPSPQTTGDKASSGTPGDAGSVPSDVGEKLHYVLKRIKDLKTHHYEEQERVLKGLQSLRHIQMDNFKVQSKALWELPWLFEEASSMPNAIKMKRRRRRQARTKNRPSA
ncbi:interferon gamma-like [Cololabis saira]|uniref:interferon gamma-like n=1 Tax=Cololabis saira TaxID=129043 RepID=UPI002AD333C5|nr:interferon gamma-like [Cololabis saira]